MFSKMTLCNLMYVFFSVWMLHHNVSGTTFTITPSQVQIGGTNPTTLNGTCTPPAGTQTVYSIYIGRKRLSSGTETTMVEIALGVNNNQPVIEDGSLRSRLSVQGDINNNPQSLSISLNDPTCNDINDYTFYCLTQFTPESAGKKEDFKNVTYRVEPDNVRMTMFPSYDKYEPRTLVTFTCTALIGSNFPTDQSNFWIWEWRDVSQMIPTSWTRYPNSANITYGTPTQAANCNYNGRSELKHTVTEYDVGRQFRCYIVDSDLYSANATISIEESTFCLLTSDDDTDDLTIGNTLTLKAAIKVKSCSTTIKYTLLSGSLMVTEFVRVDGLFYATLTLKPEYLDKPLYLKHTCSNVSATIGTQGVTILLTKDQTYCLITSNDDTDDLTIGNTLTLKAAIKGKPCTTKIKYTLLSGSLMVTDFVRVHGLFYATFEVQSEYLDKPLLLKYTCNNNSATTETEGVTILLTKDQTYCLITSDDDTEDLTIGNTLTLKAAIKVKSCSTTIKYTLLSGSLTVTDFVRVHGLFSATFEVKSEYLDKPIHLKYTCNNVSATIGTQGVTILLNKGNMKAFESSTLLGLAIGLPVGIILLAVLLGIPMIYHLKCRRPSSNDTAMYDVPSHDTNTDNRYQDLIRGGDNRPRASEIQTLPNVEYETIPPAQDTTNTSSVHRGNIDNV